MYFKENESPNIVKELELVSIALEIQHSSFSETFESVETAKFMPNSCYQSGLWYVNEDEKWFFQQNHGVAELKCPGDKTQVTYGGSQNWKIQEDFCSPMSCEDSSATLFVSTIMLVLTAISMFI